MPKLGTIGWTDLTVPDAEKTRQFYSEVIGWKSEPVSMGDYNDFSMIPPDGDQPAAGICHARGTNAGLPPVWMIYITVDDIDESIERCLALGGEVVVAPKAMGSARYCVIKDPAGAVAGLYSEG
jgi:predicted enzyme related to lactoylglutathione lyase